MSNLLRPRFSMTLAAALLAHAAAAASARRAPSSPTIPEEATGIELRLEDALLEAEPEGASEEQGAAAPAIERLAARRSHASRSKPGPATDDVGAPREAAAETPWSFQSLRNATLPALPAATAARVPGFVDTSPTPTPRDVLGDALHERDLALGLGTSAPLVEAMREEALSSRLAEGTEGTIEVDVDENGAVVEARVLSASSDAVAWKDLVQELVRRMASRRLRVPAGQHGVRARLAVVVGRTRGPNATTMPGAVPDDAPGGNRACEGTGLTRRCVAGLPLGISVTPSDLARATRAVRVRLLGESSLCPSSRHCHLFGGQALRLRARYTDASFMKSIAWACVAVWVLGALVWCSGVVHELGNVVAESSDPSGRGRIVSDVLFSAHGPKLAGVSLMGLALVGLVVVRTKRR